MAKKTYEVIGNHAVDGHMPGNQFVAVMDESRELFLIEGGHIRVVPRTKKKEEEE